jgi:hypothetical protein
MYIYAVPIVRYVFLPKYLGLPATKLVFCCFFGHVLFHRNKQYFLVLVFLSHFVGSLLFELFE